MLERKALYNLSLDLDIFFSNNNLLYLRGNFGLAVFILPNTFFYKKQINSISFLFLTFFAFKSFLAHFFQALRKLFFFSYVRLKIKGIGHRVRKISNSLYKFFFFSTSFFYFYVPAGIIFRWKKKRILMVSNDIWLLKLVLAHILLLKAVTAYRKRGVLTFKSIIFKKEGKRRI